jgi:NDP-sugar pyrophosphorylase family protein
MKQAVILAGGLGTRMLPRTERVPKFVLEVAGRPFADWQLERLAEHGFDEILICTGHLAEHVHAVVGDGARFGVRVTYAADGPVLLGTAGALRRALPLLPKDFLVTYGDSYLPFDYSAPLERLTRDATCDGVMAVFDNERKLDPSNVILSPDRARVAVYDKARGEVDPAFTWIDYGAMAFRRDVIEALPEGASMGLDAVQKDLAERGRMGAVVATERFYEIGSPQGHADLEGYLLAANGRKVPNGA